MPNNQITIKVGDKDTFTASLNENSSAKALLKMLESGPVTIDMHDYANMEKVGSLPESLPRNDTYFMVQPGDLVLYLGNQFVIYYDNNSYDFTHLGKINGNYTGSQLKSILGDGSVTVTLYAGNSRGVGEIAANAMTDKDTALYTLSGERITDTDSLPKGIYITIGAKGIKKIIR